MSKNTKKQSRTKILNILDQCKNGTIVAFKTKSLKQWHIGAIRTILRTIAETEYNPDVNAWGNCFIQEPITKTPPHLDNKTKNVHYCENISNLVILEDGKAV